MQHKHVCIFCYFIGDKLFKAESRLPVVRTFDHLGRRFRCHAFGFMKKFYCLPVLSTESVVYHTYKNLLSMSPLKALIVSVDSQINSIIGRKPYLILGQQPFCAGSTGRDFWYYLRVLAPNASTRIIIMCMFNPFEQ